jgi:WD40 repeat protein
MKKLIVFFGFIIACTANSQWLDKGDYKELNIADPTIIQFIVPKSNDYFMTIDTFLNIKQYDVQGNLVYENQIDSKQDDYYFYRANFDGSVLFYYKIFDEYIHGKNNSYSISNYYNFRLFDTKSSKLLKEYKDSFNLKSYPFTGLKYLNYNQKTNNFIYSISSGCGSRSLTNGRIGSCDGNCFLLKNDTIKDTLGLFYCKCIIHDEEMNNILVSGHYYLLDWADYYPEHQIEFEKFYFSYSDYKGNIFIRLNNFKANSDDCLRDKSFYRLSNNGKSFAFVNNSLFGQFNISGKNLDTLGDVYLDFEIKDIIYSLNDKYLIILSNDNSIKIWDVEANNVIKNYKSPDNRTILDVKIYPAGNGFLVRTDRAIRLYILDILSSCIEQKCDIVTSITISPNPTADLININGIQLETSIFETIQIYNMFGEPVLYLTPAHSKGEGVRIDVSSLPTGLYFVRVGDKVSKFVKM